MQCSDEDVLVDISSNTPFRPQTRWPDFKVPQTLKKKVSFASFASTYQGRRFSGIPRILPLITAQLRADSGNRCGVSLNRPVLNSSSTLLAGGLVRISSTPRSLHNKHDTAALL
ncbi:hypothetical protein Bbelb_264010 [Branchiostoma belcheri]|nr:hypothetical protein Bbelb_264010 [Branchiostoma belcheri]